MSMPINKKESKGVDAVTPFLGLSRLLRLGPFAALLLLFHYVAVSV